MPNISDLLRREEADNGVKKLLLEIQKVQKDMPAEVRDDINFGAMVVLYDIGERRNRRISRLERVSVWLSGILTLSIFLDIALHAEVPWVVGILDALFG